MGFANKMRHTGRKEKALFILALVLAVGVLTFAPGEALAGAIVCGQCHSNPPADADSGGCKATTKNHPAHATSDTATCGRCHPDPGAVHSPSSTHYNNLVNITSLPSLGMDYDTAGATCTNTCHKNVNAATWGGTLSCNACHYRSGAAGAVALSGRHITADRSWGHYSSSIKATDNQTPISCANCHPYNGSDNAAPRAHVNATSFARRADLSRAHEDVSLGAVGYTKGATADDATCAASCHANSDDTFGVKTTFFKPGLKRRLGTYVSSNWGQTDLNCNECHSLPSQEASYGGTTSVWGNSHHENHMFNYKLTQDKFAGDYQDIYCYDCHRYPDPDGTRSFHNHSTLGQGGSGKVSFPVKSENAKVNLTWRNNNVGMDGTNPPAYDPADATCSNVYCHTALSTASWRDRGCAECHGTNDGVLVGSGAPGYRNWTTDFGSFESYAGGGGGHWKHVHKYGYPCKTCHADGGKDGNEVNHNQGGGTVIRANVNVSMLPEYNFKGGASSYDTTTRKCANVNCHYGESKNWDCEPLH